MKILQVCVFLFLVSTVGVVAQVPKNGLVAYYPFNGNANDESGNGNNGIVYGAVLTKDRFGNPNSAYSFSNSYIEANIPGIPLNSSPRTITGWLKSGNPNYSDGNESCVLNYGSLDALKRFALCIYSKGNFDIFLEPGFSEYRYVTYGENLFNTNWHFFALMYDGNKFSLFVNGVDISNSIYPKINTIFLKTENYIFRIGRRIAGDSLNEFFNGEIDDIRIYNRVLTQQEITALYQENDTTSNDLTAPQLVNWSPNLVDGLTDNHPTFKMTFSENIKLGTGGSLKVYKVNTTTPVYIIPITANMIVDKIVSCSSPYGIDKNTNFYVLVDGTTLTDSAGNKFAGISDPSIWTFKTSSTIVLECNTLAPTGNSSQSFCNVATINDLQATGASIKWYSTPTGGTELASSTALIDGTTYYASQTIEECESQIRLSVIVSIKTTPTPSSLSFMIFCNAPIVAELGFLGTNIKIYDGIGRELGSNQRLEFGGYFASQTIDGCESLNRSLVEINIDNTNPPTGESIQNFDPGSTLASLKVTGSNIQWYSTSAGGTPLPITTPLVSGTIYYASQTVNCESKERLRVSAIPTGSEIELIEDELTYYPNPVSGLLNIQSKNIISSVTVTNISGQIVYNQNTIGSDIQIDFSKLKSGIYFVKLNPSKNDQLIKVVKN